MNCHVTFVAGIDPESRPIEIAERKGLGHPDTICDALAEEFSRALCRYYVDQFGAVLHHNVDKALLFGGATRPAFGGGKILVPIEIYLAGRATEVFRGRLIPIGELADRSCREWIRKHFHVLDPDRHLRLRCLTRPGSEDLVELFLQQRQTGVWLANDTSCGVGFAPRSELERIVIDVERRLNSPEIKQTNPEIGEDIKVLGVRRGERIGLTLAVAGVDRFLRNADDYADAKSRWAQLACEAAQGQTTRELAVEVNAADNPSAGQFYLTVTGTSAEAGDDGQVGRGNRSNGLITPCRPMTMEAVAGKNPTSHVGKLYNVAAQRIAEAVVREMPELSAAECFLVSQIGRPIHEPQLAEVRIEPRKDARQSGLAERVEQIVSQELSQLDRLSQTLALDSVVVY